MPRKNSKKKNTTGANGGVRGNNSDNAMNQSNEILSQADGAVNENLPNSSPIGLNNDDDKSVAADEDAQVTAKEPKHNNPIEDNITGADVDINSNMGNSSSNGHTQTFSSNPYKIKPGGTIEYAIEKYVNEFFKRRAHVGQTLEDIRDSLIKGLHVEFLTEFCMMPKAQQPKPPEKLDPQSVATVLAHMHTICTVARNKAGTATERDDTCVYQVDGNRMGTYQPIESKRYGLDKYVDRLHRSPSAQFTAATFRALTHGSVGQRHIKSVAETRDIDLIPLCNGIFNYRTKETIPFSPDYVFPYKSAVSMPLSKPDLPIIDVPEEYGGGTWDPESWVASLFDNDDEIHQLWCIIGAILRPNVPWDKALFFVGEDGAGGKSTVTELLRALVGVGNYSPMRLVTTYSRLQQ